ncbi:hypothetical protein DOTSEDRAFT_73739 [Dothistroma septosporum NZE10]|uniref:Uncharacterized protein n=1 Tax=Dothistroma septosporum (strain NZE10 / CBS 128990) TaxID=675120 RepID=N1PIP3_DOTSN|nr:hypothetical protein DOTSEDRAFT_73739 [Dothistroma septosporum NZE10]
MAPDINSLPTSPRLDRSNPISPSLSTNASRRASAVMGPPGQPASATLPPTPLQPRTPNMSNNDQVPMRHPRPLTAAELYLECEKEQEAVVNRLTRELTALRAQSASVASNASVSSNSTSASLLPVDISGPNPTHQMTGATHPTPSRRHRSSSSVSTRSFNTPSTNMSQAGSTISNSSTQPQTNHAANVPLHGVSQASAERAAAATGHHREPLSRQPSINASGRSTPARHSMEIPRHGGTLYTLPHRPSLSRGPSENTLSSNHAQVGTPGPVPQHLPSPAQSPSSLNVNAAMQHYVDTASYRNEMEIVKAENEQLRQRVRALERALRQRRRDSSASNVARPDPTGSTRPTRENSISERIPSMTSPLPSAGLGVAAWAANTGGVGGVAGPRERSESQSTTASSRRGLGVTEDEVRVGESASNAGVGRGI